MKAIYAARQNKLSDLEIEDKLFPLAWETLRRTAFTNRTRYVS